MRALLIMAVLLTASLPAFAETAEEHLAAFITQDLAGDGFDRLGPFVEAPTGKGGCGCASSGSHFDIAGDPLRVAGAWRIIASRHPSPEQAEVTVRFSLLADSRMRTVRFAQGRFRHLHVYARPKNLRQTYRLEKQFDGGWAVLADKMPVVSPQPLAAALARAAQAAGDAAPARRDYYAREAAAAESILRLAHKNLAD